MGKIAGGAVLCVMLVGRMVIADTTRPTVKGKTATVEVNKSVTLGGVAISFERANHKHASDGSSLGMWTFVATKGGAKKEVELRSEDEGFEAEVALHGAAFVFQHASYEKFTITLVAQTAPKPLTQDACVDRIKALATKEGKSTDEAGWSTDQGIVTLRGEGWRGHCGTLTKRVWTELDSAVDDKK